MSETEGEKAEDAASQLLDNPISDVELTEWQAIGYEAIRAAFEQAEQADLLDAALGIACRHLSAAGHYSGGAAYWRERLLAKAARQAKEGEPPAEKLAEKPASYYGPVQADGTRYGRRLGNANGTEGELDV